MILRVIYTFLVGIFLAVFVGVGISAFYKAPVYPEMPAILKYCSPDVANTTEFKSQITTFDKAEKLYQQQTQLYNRNVAIIAVVAASALVIISLTFLKTILLISDGILLGGVFTLIYSVMRGFGVQDTKFQFFVVSTGLIISLILGYIKFTRPLEKKTNITPAV